MYCDIFLGMLQTTNFTCDNLGIKNFDAYDAK